MPARFDKHLDASHVGEPQGKSLGHGHIALRLDRACDFERMADDHDVYGTISAFLQGPMP